MVAAATEIFFSFCDDNEYMRGFTLPEEVQFENPLAFLLTFGAMRKLNVTGGRDQDLLFPDTDDPYDEWHSHCPDCSIYDDGCGDVTARCQLLIENTGQPYWWIVEGYIEGVELPPNTDFSSAYVAVNATYPVPVTDTPEILFEVTRYGAHQDEWLFSDSDGKFIPKDNFAKIIHEVPSPIEPVTYLLRWTTAETDVVDPSAVDEAVTEAAEYFRRRQTDDPNGSSSIIDRYYNANDAHVSTHLKAERIFPPDSVPMPKHIDLSTRFSYYNEYNEYCWGREDYDFYRWYLKDQGIHVLFVKTIIYYDGDDVAGLGWPNRAWMVIATVESNPLANTIMHELGHNCGLECGNNIPYNIMNDLRVAPMGHDVHQTFDNQADHFRNNNPHPVKQL